jgi:O-antigen/teichoic acid export membrane protein
MFLNVLGSPAAGIIPIPHRIAQVLTQACLPAAFVLALSINPKVRIRPNLFLALYTVLAITTLMMSVRLIGIGTTYRAFRLIGFLAVIWLLTPWFGDRRLVLLRSHRRVLTLILGSVVLGLIVSPGKAFKYGRLGGAIWPIPPTQVAHYGAVLVGLTVILWMCGMVRRRSALLVIIPGLAVVIATHTRTALLAAMVGILVGGLSLFNGSRRVRRAFLGAILVVVLVGLPLSPLVKSWVARGENTTAISNLTGRTKSWALVFSEPRAETNKLLGSGLSNGGVTGQPNPALDGFAIDSSWVLAYQDQGLVGDILDGTMFGLLLFIALLRPRGPTRALALFLIVYCLVASFTESGMGIATPYLLDLTVAASLLALPASRRAGSHMRAIAARSRITVLPRRAALPEGDLLPSPPMSGISTSLPVRTPRRAVVGGPVGVAAGVGIQRGRIATLWDKAEQAVRRLGWGVADQGMSSVTNLAVSLYIARSLGATQYGAFALAYVTYSFALNASRGLATDPLLVRFSGTDMPTWRRAVASCTGTAVVVGVIAGVCLLAVSPLLSGTAKMAFLALGLTMPGLLLQDSWRFAFFAVGRGSQAFLNDTIWAMAMIPALLVLRSTGHADVFWFVFAWGAAAAVGAAAGPLQARVIPSLTGARAWVSQHRDLGFRYLLEGTSNSAQGQLRGYGVAIILGLAAVGYVQAANTLMGPFMVIFFGMGLVILPEAVRILNNSPRRLPLFCVGVSAAFAACGLAWGIVLLVILPRGLGNLLLGSIWRPTYPLILPLTISIMGGCVMAGAGTGLHALGAARRSLRAMMIASVLFVVCGVAGAALGGAPGTARGAAVATWLSAALYWWELAAAFRESDKVPDGEWFGALGAIADRARAATAPLAARLPSRSRDKTRT